MATITGLTAARMLAIEAASVVDGDIVGDDLFLTKKDGSVVNAGNVRGAPGPAGPMGSMLQVVSAQPVSDIGMINQIRAGRQLTAQDFTAMGLSAPLGLWNLSNANDSSGNNRHLTIKGGVPFGVGLNGLASTAAVFAGSTAQSLLIEDTGAGDPFRIRTGTLAFWMRSSKRSGVFDVFGKYNATVGTSGFVFESSGTVLYAFLYDGTTSIQMQLLSDVFDDKWHQIVLAIDGPQQRIYVDGILDVRRNGNFALNPNASAPLNIGSSGATVLNPATSPYNGRIDEVFITSDVLSEEQIRNLYCASIPHALGSVPSIIRLGVRRKKRGGVLAVTDFPTQPLRLYNFTNGVLTDQGANNTPLTVQGGLILAPVAGSDGSRGGAYMFPGSAGYYMQSTDANLPVGFAARSFGAWFKIINGAIIGTLISWGNQSSPANSDVRLQVINGVLRNLMGNDNATAIGRVDDGVWHFAVAVGDPSATDGLKHKLYLDGRLAQSGTTLGTNGIASLGATGFHIGSESNGANVFSGVIDAAFVCNYALTKEDIQKLYDVGSQILAVSPKNDADHIEALEVGRILGTFDTLESSDSIDLAVMA
jgi:hypothetical protein